MHDACPTGAATTAVAAVIPAITDSRTIAEPYRFEVITEFAMRSSLPRKLFAAFISAYQFRMKPDPAMHGSTSIQPPG
jgi:hypothetical protein